VVRSKFPIAAVLACLACGVAAAGAQEAGLTKNSEVGFRRVMEAAQRGRLGSDVVGASVGVEADRARVELVGADGSRRVLLLRRRTSEAAPSRYFEIEPGSGAGAADAAALAAALDEAFTYDPYQVRSYGAAPSLPGVAEAWRHGGWSAAVRVLAGRAAVPAGLAYQVAVLIGTALGLAASLVVLWRRPHAGE